MDSVVRRGKLGLEVGLPWIPTPNPCLRPYSPLSNSDKLLAQLKLSYPLRGMNRYVPWDLLLDSRLHICLTHSFYHVLGENWDFDIMICTNGGEGDLG